VRCAAGYALAIAITSFVAGFLTALAVIPVLDAA
jgi:hypothetical protein